MGIVKPANVIRPRYNNKEKSPVQLKTAENPIPVLIDIKTALDNTWPPDLSRRGNSWTNLLNGPYEFNKVIKLPEQEDIDLDKGFPKNMFQVFTFNWRPGNKNFRINFKPFSGLTWAIIPRDAKYCSWFDDEMTLATNEIIVFSDVSSYLDYIKNNLVKVADNEIPVFAVVSYYKYQDQKTWTSLYTKKQYRHNELIDFSMDDIRVSPERCELSGYRSFFGIHEAAKEARQLDGRIVRAYIPHGSKYHSGINNTVISDKIYIPQYLFSDRIVCV